MFHKSLNGAGTGPRAVMKNGDLPLGPPNLNARWVGDIACIETRRSLLRGHRLQRDREGAPFSLR